MSAPLPLSGRNSQAETRRDHDAAHHLDYITAHMTGTAATVTAKRHDDSGEGRERRWRQQSRMREPSLPPVTCR